MHSGWLSSISAHNFLAVAYGGNGALRVFTPRREYRAVRAVPRHPRETPMAIYHLSAKPPISRSVGRSAVAAAAYRAGQRIVDERTGDVHDYTKKRGVLSASLLLPGGGQHGDRMAFWNAVERHHKRKDAVLAREVVVALPAELPTSEAEGLALELAQEIADRYQVAVDCAVHLPSSKSGDERNVHAHILMTACHVESDGTLGKKAVDLDPIHCKRAGVQDSVAWLRPRWSEMVNAKLSEHGSQSRVTHVSNKAQGKHELPTVHVGVGAGSGARRALNALRKSVNGELRQVVTAISRLLDERRVLIRFLEKLAPSRTKSSGSMKPS